MAEAMATWSQSLGLMESLVKTFTPWRCCPHMRKHKTVMVTKHRMQTVSQVGVGAAYSGSMVRDNIMTIGVCGVGDC